MISHIKKGLGFVFRDVHGIYTTDGVVQRVVILWATFVHT